MYEAINKNYRIYKKCEFSTFYKNRNFFETNLCNSEIHKPSLGSCKWHYKHWVWLKSILSFEIILAKKFNKTHRNKKLLYSTRDLTDQYSTVNRTDEFSTEYTVEPINEYSCTSQGLSPGQVCLRLYILIETLNR